MLETRKPPASPRIRPAEPRRPVAPRSRSLGNTALRSPMEAAPRPTPIARPNRLARSEMRLMGLATVCTAVVCGLLLLYLAAYAHVTRLGIDQADARGQLRRNLLENEMLRAERDHLQSPQWVIPQAMAHGMTERGSTPVEYVVSTASWPGQSLPGRDLPGKDLPGKNGSADRIASLNARSLNASVGEGADQGTHGGTTADGSTAASFGH